MATEVRAWCDSAGNNTSPWADLDTFTTNNSANYNARHPDQTVIAIRQLAEKQSPDAKPQVGDCFSRMRGITMTGCLKVFPNPAKDQITISWYGVGPAKVRVWATAGSLMLEKPITDYRLSRSFHREKLNTKNWPSGVYLVEVRTEEAVMRKKLVVE